MSGAISITNATALQNTSVDLDVDNGLNLNGLNVTLGGLSGSGALALNALSQPMIDGLATWLTKSLADNNISSLGIRSAHPTAFSAGGDVRALYAARHYGCHVTTTTISREQHALGAV